ncbi:hypothetical protein QOZ80_7AG0571130 [Eleusine coracana subsp. coracana]|nr:hypothetical protein QOZ80_7AG0571130 [Eleusine coracana subsp. coracana]
MDVETGVSVAEKGATANKAAPPAPDETAAGWKAPAAMVLVQLFNTGMVLLSKVAIGGGMFVFALLAYRRPLRRGHHTSLGAPPREGKVERDRLVCRWMDLAQCVHWICCANEPLLLWPGGHDRIVCSHLSEHNSSNDLCTVPHIQDGGITNWYLSRITEACGGYCLCRRHNAHQPLQGKTLHLWNPILHHHNEESNEVASHQLRGTILLLGSSFMFACWYLIQTSLAGVILRRDKSAWKIGWDINLVTIVYSGALATAGKYSLNSWAVAKKGPAYPPMFSPLSVVFTVVLGSIFIGDDITVGRRRV